MLNICFPATPTKHYIIDERFTSYYETQQPGLAQWLADAIEAEAQHARVDPANPTWN